MSRPIDLTPDMFQPPAAANPLISKARDHFVEMMRARPGVARDACRRQLVRYDDGDEVELAAHHLTLLARAKPHEVPAKFFVGCKLARGEQ